MAVKTLFAARSSVGLKVAMVPAKVTTPKMFVAPWLRVMVVVLMVAASIASLKMIVTFVSVGTSISRSTGLVESTVGAVVSRAPPVVKVKVSANSIELPAKS